MVCRVLHKSPGSRNLAGVHQASNTRINPAPHNASKCHLSPSQIQARLEIQSSLFTADSPEPYVSVGCLKCGASDHVATNRNCPRPRKAAPAASTIPVQTHAVKKNITRSPKKSAVDNHHLKEAKVGDDTKFWYYISDDSEEGEQGDSRPGKRICVETSQTQGSATHGEYHGLAEDGVRMALDPIDESMQLGLSSRHIINKGSGKLGRDKVVKSSQSNDKAVRIATYGTGTSDTTTLSGPQGAQTNAGLRPESRNTYDGSGLGLIPSLPWKISTTSPLSPVKHSVPSPGSEIKTTKIPRQRKIAPKSPAFEERGGAWELDTLSQKQLRKGAKVSHLMPAVNKSQQNIGLVAEATQGKAHPSHLLRQPAPVQPSPVHYSRYPAVTPRHTNRTFAQSIEDSFSAEKAEITKFRYNYMGARNTVQQPRVQYSPDRVQGWRECRSMGTGLE